MRSAILIVAALLACANAHSYMNVPFGFTPTSGAESTTAPCGNAALTNYSVTVELNAYVAVGWVYNTHQGDTQAVTIRLLDYTNRSIGSVVRVIGNTTFTPNSYYVRIPGDIATGDYLIQWTWSGWYTCAWIRTTAQTTFVNRVTPGNTTFYPTLLRTIDNYEVITTDTIGNFLYTTATPSVAGTSVTVVMTNTPVRTPSLTVYDDIADSSTSLDGTVTVGTCPSTNIANANMYEIGVTGGASASGTVTYTLSFNEYEGLVNSGRNISVTAHNGNRYFATQSYETSASKQMVVLRSTLDHNDIQMLVDTACTFSTTNLITATYPDDKTICAQLGTTTGTKYVRVAGIQSGYVLSTEKGSCSDLGSAASVAVSMTLLVCALIASLLF